MAKTKYEVTYIIKPDADENSKKALIDHFNRVVTDNGTEELESEDWGKRCFAYEIEKYREDTCHIMIFATGNSEPVNESGRPSRIDNQVLRSVTVKLDK